MLCKWGISLECLLYAAVLSKLSGIVTGSASKSEMCFYPVKMLRYLPKSPFMNTTKLIEDRVRKWVMTEYGGEDGYSEAEMQAIQNSFKFVDQEGDEPLKSGGCDCEI